MPVTKRLCFTFALLCICAVLGFAQTYPPAMMGVSPANGTGATWNGYIYGWNYSGGASIQYLWLRFGETINGCNVLFDIPGNRVLLLSDNGMDWGPGAIMGTNTALSNSKCSFNANTAYKVVSGNYATGYATLQFKTAFAGAQVMWGWVNNTAGQNSGWIPVGNPAIWTVPGLQPPGGLSIWPASSTDTTRTFTVQFSDPAGTANVDYVLIGLGGWSPGCTALVRPNSNTVTLVNDANTDWLSPATIGSTANVANSFCQVNTNPTSLYFINSTTLAINISVMAKASFSGNGITSAFVNGFNGLNSGAVNLGTWNPIIVQPPDEIIAWVEESPATLNPGEVGMSKVTLSQAGQDLNTMALRVYHVNDPVTFRIRFGRPNQQVWVQRRAMSFVDGAWVNETLCSPTIGLSGHEQDGACLLGSTDSTGFFQWSGTILNSLIGMTTVEFYLGSQTPDLTYPTTTYGPMNQDNAIGALVYFVIGTSGFPQPPVW